jgi:hypothetical protein
MNETKENYWNKWITIHKKTLKKIHNVNSKCLKRIHSVETSIVASGYGSRKHKPPKKSGTPLVKGPNVLQKKPQGWSNTMGGGLGSRNHNDY